MEINERQRFLLDKVIRAHVAEGQPVGSKWLSEQPDFRSVIPLQSAWSATRP